MSFDDPIRLKAGGSPELRALLRSTAIDAPTAAQVATLTATLEAAATSVAVASTTAAAAGTSAGVTTAAGLGLKAWLVVATLGASAVGGTVAWQQTRDQRPTVSSSIAVTQPIAPTPTSPTPIAPVPDVAPTPAVVAPTETSPTETSPRRTAASIAHRPRAIPPPSTAPAASPPGPPPASTPTTVDAAPAVAAPPPTAPPRESDLLRGAQRALQRADARLALDLTASHATYYPRGVFSEEREAIAIEALAQLGHTDAANARLEQFLTRFPRSGYRPRLQRLLAAGSSR